jgi:hypothetical protein
LTRPWSTTARRTSRTPGESVLWWWWWMVVMVYVWVMLIFAHHHSSSSMARMALVGRPVCTVYAYLRARKTDLSTPPSLFTFSSLYVFCVFILLNEHWTLMLHVTCTNTKATPTRSGWLTCWTSVTKTSTAANSPRSFLPTFMGPMTTFRFRWVKGRV